MPVSSIGQVHTTWCRVSGSYHMENIRDAGMADLPPVYRLKGLKRRNEVNTT